MKQIIIVIALMCGFIATSSGVFAQGSLTPPPGGPAPSMKSLDQIEPRMTISYANFSINHPGSYYVTTNLIGGPYGVPGPGPRGIWIESDNVTVDLEGFTLQGVAGSFSGIYIYGGHTNIVVRNGIVTGWGEAGIDYQSGSSPQNVTLENLTVSGNTGVGILVGNGYNVSNCNIQGNGNTGIAVNGTGSHICHNIINGNNTSLNSTSCGIILEGPSNWIEDNHITGHAAGYGIEYDFSTGMNNVVIKNSVIGNIPNNYSSGDNNNDVGPISTAALASSPWANLSK